MRQQDLEIFLKRCRVTPPLLIKWLAWQFISSERNSMGGTVISFFRVVL